MTYHCMTKLGSVVAAFGPVSGIPVDYRDPVVVRKVPIMHIHGTGDDVVNGVVTQTMLLVAMAE